MSSQLRILTVSELSAGTYKPRAYIRLFGNWLERCGFMPGNKIMVSVEQNKLVIERVKIFDPNSNPNAKESE